MSKLGKGSSEWSAKGWITQAVKVTGVQNCASCVNVGRVVEDVHTLAHFYTTAEVKFKERVTETGSAKVGKQAEAKPEGGAELNQVAQRRHSNDTNQNTAQKATVSPSSKTNERRELQAEEPSQLLPSRSPGAQVDMDDKNYIRKVANDEKKEAVSAGEVSSTLLAASSDPDTKGGGAKVYVPYKGNHANPLLDMVLSIANGLQTMGQGFPETQKRTHAAVQQSRKHLEEDLVGVYVMFRCVLSCFDI